MSATLPREHPAPRSPETPVAAVRRTIGPPAITEALAFLRQFGPGQLRTLGAHRSAKSLERVLAYVERLEAQLVTEQRARADFEASAEGEFHELRQQVRAWQTYAAHLEERRDALAGELRALLGSLQGLANSRWWRRRDSWDGRCQSGCPVPI